MDSPISGLDSREFALVVWIGVGLVLALLSTKLREHIVGLLKTLLGWKVLLIFGSMAGYVAVLVWLLSRANFWTADLASETMFWWLFIGLPILFRAVTAGGQEDFFKKTALSSIGGTALVDFVVNLRPFNIAVELLMVLPLFVLFGTLAHSQATQPAGHTSGVLLGLAMAVVLFFLGYTWSVWCPSRIVSSPMSLF